MTSPGRPGDDAAARIRLAETVVAGDGGSRVADLRLLRARAARWAPLPELPEPLGDRLRLLGVDRLYTHQSEALTHVFAGRHVVIATGTASGKSLCYQVPIASEAIRDSSRTALYLSPTKALARDQLRQLRTFRVPHVRAAVYDGDTTPADRDAIRSTANVVLTNPDMLHVGILPHHRRWQTFLQRLSLVVVDECHVARGVFGAHVAGVLRRLLRLTDHHGARPTFVLSSATIANPGVHAAALTGLQVEEVTDDGSPRPARAVALWAPPLEDPEAGRWRSTLAETADLLAELTREGRSTLAFVKSRKGAELVAIGARRRLGDAVPVRAYRAGLLPHERREVEQGLLDGSLPAVAATDALELGVDVGGLDAVVIGGWPGTAASLWQQAGRAGRRDTEAAVVFVAGDDPLDRYLVANPEEFFGRPLEEAAVDATNPHVIGPHLRCAAAELPLQPEEPRFAPVDVAAIAADETARGRLRERGGRWYATGRSPATDVGLRSIGGPAVQIVAADTGQLIGDVDRSRAHRTVHTGAVYLHQGQPWRVSNLDLAEGIATVEPDPGTTTTSARSDTDISILGVRRTCPLPGAGPGRPAAATLNFGNVAVQTLVHSYERTEVFTGASLGVVPLDLPPQTLTTTALWVTVPHGAVGGLTDDVLPGAAHAAEHAAIGLLPLFAMCDRWDIGGVSTARHADTGMLTIFIYDGYAGGAGIAERGYRTGETLWRATRRAVASCPCAVGCPSCIQSPKCGNGNTPLDKAGAVALLDAALGRSSARATA